MFLLLLLIKTLVKHLKQPEFPYQLHLLLTALL